MTKAQNIKGSKAEILKAISQMPDDVVEAIVFIREAAQGSSTSNNDDIFAEMEPYMVNVPNVDYSREAIYGLDDSDEFDKADVRDHRTKLGLSAKDYGKLVGVSAETVYHWEKGDTKPSGEIFGRWKSLRRMNKRAALRALASI